VSDDNHDSSNDLRAGAPVKEILDFHEAAAFLGVSTKTFSKILRNEDLPGRKVGREWKFSKAALLAWIGSGHTRDFKDEGEADDEPAPRVSLPAEAPRPRPALRDTFSADED
jgi:excisionase family DNA binding protein